MGGKASALSVMRQEQLQSWSKSMAAPCVLRRPFRDAQIGWAPFSARLLTKNVRLLRGRSPIEDTPVARHRHPCPTTALSAILR